MEEQKEKKQGHKGKGQKYKSLLVWDILQKRTDENHAIQLKDNQAIRENKKISFRYQKFTIKDRTQQVDRRGGATYIISPFKLIINDGYNYVLTWDSKKDRTITYRLD